MENVRTWKNGDVMHPQSFTITTTDQRDWTNPLIEVRSAVCDVRDGEIYHPAGLTVDSFHLSDLVKRGVWTVEEAGAVMTLFLKAYVGVDNSVE